MSNLKSPDKQIFYDAYCIDNDQNFSLLLQISQVDLGLNKTLDILIEVITKFLNNLNNSLSPFKVKMVQ